MDLIDTCFHKNRVDFLNCPNFTGVHFLMKSFSLRFNFFFILLFPVSASLAQIINIDVTDTSDYSKKAKWNGNFAAGLEVDKQKTTLFDASNFFDASLQKEHELLILSASNRFTYNGPQDFLNEGFAHLRWRHYYKNPLHAETYVQYQWDAKIGMLSRFVAGVNARYTIWHRHNWEITFATGLMMEHERWNYVAVDSSKIPPGAKLVNSDKLKSNSYIKWEGKVSKEAVISAVVFYQAAFNSFFSPRIATRLKFDIDVSKHFTFNVSFNGLYDAKPVVPIFRFYYSLSNAIVYKF